MFAESSSNSTESRRHCGQCGGECGGQPGGDLQGAVEGPDLRHRLLQEVPTHGRVPVVYSIRNSVNAIL